MKTNPVAEFYATAEDTDIIGEVCETCRWAAYGTDLYELLADSPKWNASAYLANAERYDTRICEDPEQESRRFTYRGMCDLCESWEGGNRWPVILTPRTPSTPTLS